MDSPIVSVAQSQLRGGQRTDIDGRTFLYFLGVPYAKPPIGELRFKAPLPAEPWIGIREATKEGEICYSREELTSKVMGSEDCLLLNVYTKELPVTMSGNKLKPVMVYIHGGGFTAGSNRPDHYGPEFLMTQDIVLVTINYRLGLLGFLALEDASLGVPGNAGLKDQQAALKWVQENIKCFGGDPNNVTIFGESAGSFSVHFHILSPTSAGLFHKAIMQSGSAFNPWAYGGRIAQKVAGILGHETKNEKEALEILKKVPVEQLFEAQEKCGDVVKPSVPRYFGAVIETPNETAFFTKNPIDVILSGAYNKVPMMFGYTSREGMILEVIKAMKERFGIDTTEEPNLEDAIPWQMNLERGSPESLKIADKLQQMYFNGPDLADNLFVLSTDSSFLAGIMAAVKNHIPTSQNPIYLYRMSLDASLNFLKNLVKINHIPGACHADDLGYLFKSVLTPEIKPGSLEDKSVKRFVKLWTNFATYGNPTPDHKELGVTWAPIKDDHIKFLDIGEDLEMHENPEADRMALWKEIFQTSPATEHFL